MMQLENMENLFAQTLVISSYATMPKEYREKLFNPTREHKISLQSLRLNKDKKMCRSQTQEHGFQEPLHHFQFLKF